MNQEAPDVSNMFIVSPMGQTITLAPGETYSGSIMVTNPATANSDFEFHVTVSPYSVVDEEYSVDLGTVTERSRMVDWIKISNPSGVLAPNESQKVKFTITVPEDAPGGGQYAALMVGSADHNNNAGSISVSNVYEIASIVYAKISGEVDRQGSILENDFPGFVLSMPIVASARVQNDGNIHETAHVTVTVKNALTGDDILSAKDEISTIDEVIMPGTTRSITRDIAGISDIGIYEITQEVDYMGQSSTETHQVIACPVWLLVTIGLILTGLVATIVALIHRHRRRLHPHRAL